MLNRNSSGPRFEPCGTPHLTSLFMKNLVPKTTLTKVYNAIILPHFDYCSLVWDNDYLIDKLQKLQNRAARVITGKTYETRSLDVLKELDWQPLKERFKQRNILRIRLEQ